MANSNDALAGETGISVSEAARAIGVSRATINGWIREGLLPATLVARRRVVRRSDLEATYEREHASGVVPAWRADPHHAGRRLRQLREAAGLSQLALAEVSGLTHEAISVLELGGRSPHGRTVHQLAAALDVAPAQFVGEAPLGMSMLTIAEAASRLDVPPRRVQRWLRDGHLEGTKVAGHWSIPAIVVAELDRSGQLRGKSRRLHQSSGG